MKTIYKVSALSGLLLLCLVFFICSRLNAQTIISIESSPDSVFVMKIQNMDLMEKSQDLILIIDSTLVTYQLNDEKVFAFLDTRHQDHPLFKIHQLDAVKSEMNVQDHDLMDYLVEKTIMEEDEEEDTMDLEEWMYHSEDWLEEK